MTSVCNIGTSFTAEKWLTLDPCGIGCNILSYCVHIYAFVIIEQTMISYSSSSTFIFYVLYLPCALLALSNLFMAQHTDPGAIPLGARPLRIYDDGNGFNDAENGEGGASGGAGGDCSKSETSSVASSLLDGIDGSQVMAHGHGNSNDAGRKKGVRRCRKCRNNYKPPRAHHDSVTGRCVSKFDHFCPVSLKL